LSAGQINFTYRVDRLDELADGTIMILDYKAGSNDPMPQDMAKVASLAPSREAIKKTVRSFQMPLYYHYFSKKYPGKTINAAFYNLRTLEINEFFKEKPASDPQKINSVFLPALDHIVREILDPQVSFKPDDSDLRLCEVCPYFNACR